MIYPLHALNKEQTLLQPSTSYYSEDYARNMCSLYLKDELVRDENGDFKKVYRLNAKYDHNEAMAFAYDIHCPKCKGMLKQVGRQETFNKLGLYTCPCCNR